MDKRYALTMAAALASFSATAAGPAWQSNAGVPQVCGGVSLEEFAELHAQRSAGNTELLFTAGPYGEYLADVNVSISGKNLASPLQWTSQGPLCLLKLPPGNYQVNVSYEGMQQSHALKVGRGVTVIQFHYPTHN